MAYTFMRAQGKEIGKSLVEEDKVDLAKELLERADGKIILPIDFGVIEDFENIPPEYVSEIPANKESLDIGPKTIELFRNELAGAKTVVWNGPMGVFEMSNFAKGTIGVCEAIANLEEATTIIGGGDSAAASRFN